MKTAISLPDDTFDRASRRARDLGLSRSEFFARAARWYLNELDAHSTTVQVNDVLGRIGALDDSSIDAVASGRRRIVQSDDRW